MLQKNDEFYPSAFQFVHSHPIARSVIAMDDGSLLETKPFSHSRTVGDCAEQLVAYVCSLLGEHVTYYISE